MFLFIKWTEQIEFCQSFEWESFYTCSSLWLLKTWKKLPLHTPYIKAGWIQGLKTQKHNPYLCAVLQLKLVKESPRITQVWLNLNSPEEPLSGFGDFALTPEQPMLYATNIILSIFTQLHRHNLSDVMSKREMKIVDKWTYLATASKTWGSCSHFFKASTLLVFLWGLASKNTASAHKIPSSKRGVVSKG